MVGHNLDIRDLSLNAIAMDRGLMDHNLGVGQGNTLALGAAGQKKGPKACGKSDTDGVLGAKGLFTLN